MIGIMVPNIFAESPSGDCSKINPNMILINCDLTKVNFKDLEIHGSDLSGANLSDVNLSGMNLSKVNFSGADLIRTDLSGSNLENTNFENANLNKKIDDNIIK